MWEKLKQLLQDNAVFYSLIVTLTAVLAFGLGRASLESNTQVAGLQRLPDFYLETNDMSLLDGGTVSSAAPTAVTEPSVQNQNFVASKTGKRYYPTSCSGVSRIKDTNRVYFASEPAAMAAGYSRAANCNWSE